MYLLFVPQPFCKFNCRNLRRHSFPDLRIQSAMAVHLARAIDYRLPPSGSSARSQVVQHLFMTVQQRVSICEGEVRKCEADPLSRGITFELVNHDWVWGDICSTLDRIAADEKFDMIYCGVMSNPLWRWERGRNQLEGLKPHSDRYDGM